MRARSWTHLRLRRPGPRQCRVTFDHPPINAITADTVAELAELVGLIESDQYLNVVVFDTANPDHYLAHYDIEDDPEKTVALGVGPTGMPAWVDLLVRLSRAPVVSIAAIRGRARGAGREFMLACDLRFSSRAGPDVDRVIPGDSLDAEVDSIAARFASFDHEAIARTKADVDGLTPLPEGELPPALSDFFQMLGRPTQRVRFARLPDPGRRLNEP